VQRLAQPEPGPQAAEEWVDAQLADVCADAAAPSPRFRGGQLAADRALAAFDVRGYARRRNDAWPAHRRGASALSPYIRHGLLSLRRVWEAVADGPAADVSKFRDELLWQEYARHLYARLGHRMFRALRAEPAAGNTAAVAEPWRRDMACVRMCLEELETDGWLVNQTRMWLASQWTVRSGAEWEDGERLFFRHLLDGSAAANLLGWQWTVGTATGRAYGFRRWQVEKRAPGICSRCSLASDCPIEEGPAAGRLQPVPAPPALSRDSNLDRTRGPLAVVSSAKPEAVWLTAESLGNNDPALAANPRLPAIFVFDVDRLRRWQLSRKRVVFLVETLAEIGLNRELELRRGDPAEALSDRPVAATFSPVPGWKKIARGAGLAEIHPWPWLCTPVRGAIQSYSAWRKLVSPPKLRPTP
jgi:deoxyribodipyrimidine photo-lyase